MGEKQIEVRPKLKAGSKEDIRIVGYNINGFPSSKDNTHKLKGIKELLEDKDGAIILETGINKDRTMLIPDAGIEICKENKMPHTDKG